MPYDQQKTVKLRNTEALTQGFLLDGSQTMRICLFSLAFILCGQSSFSNTCCEVVDFSELQSVRPNLAPMCFGEALNNLGVFHVQDVSVVKVDEVSYAIIDRRGHCLGVFNLGHFLRVGAATLDDGQVLYELYGNHEGFEAVVSIGESELEVQIRRDWD